MGIKIPSYHLKAANDLPELRRRLKGGGRHRQIHEELTLTSLIDIMSIIILFLIQSFSATGDILIVSDKIKLPEAAHARLLMRNPIITVTADMVALEGYQVGDNADIADKIEETDWALPQLSEKLTEYKTFYEKILVGETFPGTVIVQADRGLDFIYLKRVMFTLAKLGFGNVNLAVRGKAVEGLPQESLSTSQ